MAVTFVDFFPQIPSETEMMMLQGMTYRTTVTLPAEVEPNDVLVQAWTSQCDRFSSDGQWHAIDLAFLGSDVSWTRHEYGVTRSITGDKNFHFTFRARVKTAAEQDGWQWSHPFGVNGYAYVLPCRDEDEWTQGPNFDHITGALYLGNFIAATHATECGFTHVLNVAQTLDVVFPHNEVVYHKILMIDGSQHVIEDEQLLDSVHWIKKHDKPGNKILLNCRAGIGRAGSAAIAYVYYLNPDMSYQDAYDFCFAKRYVYPHFGLQSSIERLFPR